MGIKPKELLDKLLVSVKRDSPDQIASANSIQGLSYWLDHPLNEGGEITNDSFVVRVPLTTENTKWVMKMNITLHEVR